MGHGHSHDQGHHNHGHHNNERRLLITALLTGGFMLVEAVGGVVSGSLALLADAGHMLADFGGLVLAWLAFRFSRWPADRRRTYGFGRLQVLVAFGNGLLLFGIAALILVEAGRRLLFEPVEVLAGTMLWVAVGGLAVNVVAFLVLHGADRDNLNVRGAFLHVVGDLLGSAGAIAGAVIIMLTGWTAADPIVSVLVAAIILKGAYGVVRESGHILLEGAPVGLAPQAIERDLSDHVEPVADVHHLHAWSITQERTMVTLHARLRPGSVSDVAIAAIKARLRHRFGIDHVTVEIEHEACADGAASEPQAHAHHGHGDQGHGDHGHHHAHDHHDHDHHGTGHPHHAHAGHRHG